MQGIVDECESLLLSEDKGNSFDRMQPNILYYDALYEGRIERAEEKKARKVLRREHRKRQKNLTYRTHTLARG